MNLAVAVDENVLKTVCRMYWSARPMTHTSSSATRRRTFTSSIHMRRRTVRLTQAQRMLHWRRYPSQTPWKAGFEHARRHEHSDNWPAPGPGSRLERTAIEFSVEDIGIADAVARARRVDIGGLQTSPGHHRGSAGPETCRSGRTASPLGKQTPGPVGHRQSCRGTPTSGVGHTGSKGARSEVGSEHPHIGSNPA